MELWKVEKFLETASYLEVLAIERTLRHRLEIGHFQGTNAKAILAVVQETIELRHVFGEGQK